MPRRVLVAVNLFEERHVEAMARAVDGWADVRVVAEAMGADVYEEQLGEAEVVVGWPPPELLLDSPVRFCQLLSAGYEQYVGIGLERKPDFALSNAGDVMAVPVAEHAVAQMLTLARRLERHAADMRERNWERHAPYREVAGTTACVVGLGPVGTEIARRCLGLGLEVIGVRRDPSKGHELLEHVRGPDQLHDALADADHVFLAASG